MRYFVARDDMGYIVMRAAEARESLPDPEDWAEVAGPREHIGSKGIEHLHSGGHFVFSADDRSYPRLVSLFAEAD